MFDHVTIRVSDRTASERFYDTVLPVLGRSRTSSGERFVQWGDFSLAADEQPVTRRLHVAFFAPTHEEVDAFWRTGIGAGYADDGEPGLRPQYSSDYYGAFLLDPDGNSVEAVSRRPHRPDKERGAIDHVWLRVADLASARAFYETIAPYSGFAPQESGPAGGVQFRAESGTSFSIVRGTPSAQVHLAFPARDNATVDGFHRVALAAGHRDNGAPGERPIYHAGYYGAFVLDPDGNNVEVVNHSDWDADALPG